MAGVLPAGVGGSDQADQSLLMSMHMGMHHPQYRTGLQARPGSGGFIPPNPAHVGAPGAGYKLEGGNLVHTYPASVVMTMGAQQQQQQQQHPTPQQLMAGMSSVKTEAGATANMLPSPATQAGTLGGMAAVAMATVTTPPVSNEGSGGGSSTNTAAASPANSGVGTGSPATSGIGSAGSTGTGVGGAPMPPMGATPFAQGLSSENTPNWDTSTPTTSSGISASPAVPLDSSYQQQQGQQQQQQQQGQEQASRDEPVPRDSVLSSELDAEDDAFMRSMGLDLAASPGNLLTSDWDVAA